MNNSERIYRELRKAFSDQEIAEGYVFPMEASDRDEKDQSGESILKMRLQSVQERSEEQNLLAGLMQLKLELRDYFERNIFEETYCFSMILERYVQLIGRSQKTFAEEIDVHPTKLSRIINGKENPNIELSYRLETHCGNIIPAVYWWRLHARRIEEDIRTNRIMRDEERHKVKNNLTFRA
jgi:plasmid maintenance system antidote protein VapI